MFQTVLQTGTTLVKTFLKWGVNWSEIELFCNCFAFRNRTRMINRLISGPPYLILVDSNQPDCPLAIVGCSGSNQSQPERTNHWTRERTAVNRNEPRLTETPVRLWFDYGIHPKWLCEGLWLWRCKDCPCICIYWLLFTNTWHLYKPKNKYGAKNH